MEIRIIFNTENAAFQDYPHGDGNFNKEIEYVMNQATEFLVGDMRNEKLIDSNGNTVGTVWVSTTNRRG